LCHWGWVVTGDSQTNQPGDNSWNDRAERNPH
jgi:hypothetical protein